MPRCETCKQFRSIDESDPEVEEIEIDEDGTSVTLSVRIVNTCVECGEGLTEALLEMEHTIDTPLVHTTTCTKAEYDIEATDVTRTTRTEGKSTRAPKFYGALVICKISCMTCEAHMTVDIMDDIKASEMDIV